MKQRSYVLATIVGILATGQMAQAAFSIEDLYTATKASVDNFKKENASHVEHFSGYKAWLSGEESKVKVYVKHDGMTMEFNYVCHKHDSEIECHAQ